jgi:hypothetical protein
MYNWFPTAARVIRKRTTKPRSEFFALSQPYLHHALGRKWFGYEQTIVLLLQNVIGSEFQLPVDTIPLGQIPDSEAGRDELKSAMTQVERAERVLKQYWRENSESMMSADWPREFSRLDHQSAQIRGAALVILEQMLSTAR